MLLNPKERPDVAQPTPENSNVKGIFLALRYLSREAEGAGLTELAKTLEEAESKWDKSIESKQDSR